MAGRVRTCCEQLRRRQQPFTTGFHGKAKPRAATKEDPKEHEGRLLDRLLFRERLAWPVYGGRWHGGPSTSLARFAHCAPLRMTDSIR